MRLSPKGSTRHPTATNSSPFSRRPLVRPTPSRFHPSWFSTSVNYPGAKDTPVTNDATMTHDGKTETATGKTTLNGLIGDVKLAAFEGSSSRSAPRARHSRMPRSPSRS